MIRHLLVLLLVTLVNGTISIADVNTTLVSYCRKGYLAGIEQIWVTMSQRSRLDHIPVCLDEALTTGKLEVFEWVLSRPEAQVMDLTFLDLLKFGQNRNGSSFMCSIKRHLNMREAFMSNCRADLYLEVSKDLSHFNFDPTYLEDGLRLACQHGSYQSAIQIVSSKFSDQIPEKSLEQIFLQACWLNVPELVKAILINTAVDPTTHFNSALCLASDNGHNDVVACLLRDPRVDPRFSENYLFHHIVGYSTPKMVYMLMSDRRFLLSETAIIASINDGNLGTASLLLAHPHATLKFLNWLCSKPVHPDSPLFTLMPLIETIKCLKADQKFDAAILDDDQFVIVLLAASLNGKHECLSLMLSSRKEVYPDRVRMFYRLAEKMGQTKVLQVFNAQSQCIMKMNSDKYSLNARFFELCSWRATGPIALLVKHLCTMDAKVRQCMKGLSKEECINMNADALERHIYSKYAGLKGIQALLRNANAVFYSRVLLKAFLPPILVEVILDKVQKSLVHQSIAK